jgi:hypothetical protein
MSISRHELLDRHQHAMNLTLHVARRAIRAVAEQPCHLPHRLPGALIGNAVHHDDSNAIGCHEFGAAIIAVACQEASIFYRPGSQTPAIAPLRSHRL